MIRLDPDSPNTFIGVILLVMLAVFVLPDRLPRFIADLSPQLFAGIPCGRLPAAKDLAAHQSALGRSAVDPLLLEVAASKIGTDDGLTIRLSVTNISLGTVGIIYQEDNIVVAGTDDSSDGFGLIINPAPASGTQDREDPNPASYAEADIRLLGPRQNCVHATEVTASAGMIAAGGTARAYYRMSVAGEQQAPSEGARQIYPDQGLDILSESVTFSQEVEIMPRS